MSGPAPGSTLRAILETLAGAPLPAWDSLTPHLQVVRLRKGATLFDVGSYAPHFYVVRRGTTRRRTRARPACILLHPGRGDLVQRAPHHGRRCHRTEYPTLVTQHVDISDCLATVSQRHRHVGQHPTPVMARNEITPGHRSGQRRSQAGPVGQQPGRDAARVRHHPDTITRHHQASRPRSTLHLRSAFHLGQLGTSQSQVAPAGQALPHVHAPGVDA